MRGLTVTATVLIFVACGDEAPAPATPAEVATPDDATSDVASFDTSDTSPDVPDDVPALDIVPPDVDDDVSDAQPEPELPPVPDVEPDTGPPPDPTWQTRAPLPIEVTENAAAALGGQIYVAGGFVGLESPPNVYRYDPETDAWTEVAPLPQSGYHHASLVAHGGTLYLVAGQVGLTFTPSGNVYAYDPVADQWSTRATAPVPRGAAGAVVIDDLIYVAGGVTTDDGVSGTLVAYDPAADSWNADLPPMAVPREHVAACALNGRMHVFGGRFGGLNNKADHEVFDPVAGTWSTAEPMPTARSGIAAAVLNGRCHVFGGEQDTGTFDQHEVWSDEEGWTILAPLPTARHGLGAVTLGDTIHVIGGGPSPGFTYSNAHEVFGP